MRMPRFTERARKIAQPIWDATLDHPMVKALGEGTLDEAPFRQWVKQDYLFLIDYSRLFALGTVKAPDLQSMGTFATLLHETLNTEMELHRGYAAELGITKADLEATEAGPTTRAYTDFLVRTASTGAWPDICAALLPCMWGFNDTATRLAAAGRPKHPQYAAWIDMYAGKDFTELTKWCIQLTDAAAFGRLEADLGGMERIFLTSARYEYMFWDAAWKQETWPV